MPNVTPAGEGGAQVPAQSAFSSRVKEVARNVLQKMPVAKHPQSNVIEERLQESEKLDVLSAGIPGSNLPETGKETEVAGHAVIHGAKKAQESAQREVKGALGRHSISKGGPSLGKEKNIPPPTANR